MAKTGHWSSGKTYRAGTSVINRCPAFRIFSYPDQDCSSITSMTPAGCRCHG